MKYCLAHPARHWQYTTNTRMEYTRTSTASAWLSLRSAARLPPRAFSSPCTAPATDAAAQAGLVCSTQPCSAVGETTTRWFLSQCSVTLAACRSPGASGAPRGMACTVWRRCRSWRASCTASRRSRSCKLLSTAVQIGLAVTTKRVELRAGYLGPCFLTQELAQQGSLPRTHASVVAPPC